MFNNAITLNPQAFGGANVDKVYDLVSWGGDTSSIRRVAATATTTPETLTVSHRERKVSGVIVDEHLVRLDEELVDPAVGPVGLRCWISIGVPRGTTVVTEQKIKDIVGRLIAFEQAAGALAKILNSEP